MPSARSRRPGLLGSVSRTAVVSGTVGATSNTAERRARARWDQEASDAGTVAPDMPAAEVPAAEVPAAGGQLADQLARLAELRISGVLTDDEFAAAKARLLT
ncbi:SHOCT domain-containing protein [Arthrobacter mangrovi]|uniref:SHOCT domain-containing protein n=1 Tax=Arthrobacter mangrovi TaxID=2966350 RepID=A0ABQ5MZM1_9MICC|nr:SHOCT domain-containing protein [Arthrobacter mangrovi]GLB69440.1 hypothetical protein AHIS1636_38850 [Arthrobacter mangrovi]